MSASVTALREWDRFRTMSESRQSGLQRNDKSCVYRRKKCCNGLDPAYRMTNTRILGSPDRSWFFTISASAWVSRPLLGNGFPAGLPEGGCAQEGHTCLVLARPRRVVSCRKNGALGG